MHGHGCFSHEDGKIYLGFFTNDRKNGLGCLKYTDGTSYNGFFKNDLQHGKGLVLNQTGKVLVKGEWREGVKKSEFGEEEVNGFEAIFEMIKKEKF